MDDNLNNTFFFLILNFKKNFNAGRVPKDRSWRAAKIMMGRVDQFLDSLINYDKENIHPDVIKAIQSYLDDPEFDPEFVRSKSTAAAGLCSWVINIVRFFEVFCEVEPKRRALIDANLELENAQEKEATIKAKVKALEATLQELTTEFERANSEKRACQQEGTHTNQNLLLFDTYLCTKHILKLANHLISTEVTVY